MYATLYTRCTQSYIRSILHFRLELSLWLFMLCVLGFVSYSVKQMRFYLGFMSLEDGCLLCWLLVYRAVAIYPNCLLVHAYYCIVIVRLYSRHFRYASPVERVAAFLFQPSPGLLSHFCQVIAGKEEMLQ